MARILQLFAAHEHRSQGDFSSLAARVLHDGNLLELILSHMPSIAIRSLHHHCLSKRGAIESLIARMSVDRLIGMRDPFEVPMGEDVVKDTARMLEVNIDCGWAITRARLVYEAHAIPGTRVTHSLRRLHHLIDRAEHPWISREMLIRHSHGPIIQSILGAIAAGTRTIVVDGPPGSAKTAIILEILRASPIPATAVTFSRALAQTTTAEWGPAGFSMQTSNSVALRDYRARIPRGSAKWGSGRLVDEDEFGRYAMDYFDLMYPRRQFTSSIVAPPSSSDAYIAADPASDFPYYTHAIYEQWVRWFPTDKGKSLLIVDEYQDASAATCAVAAGYTGGIVLYMGDPNQRLSGDQEDLDLTGALRLSMCDTFRFGPDVAWMCNNLIEEYPLMFGRGERLRRPPAISEVVEIPSAAEDAVVIAFANRDAFHITEKIIKKQKKRRVEFLSKRLLEMRRKHMPDHRGSGRVLTAGTIHSVKGVTFRNRTVIVQRGLIHSAASKRRYLVSLSRIQGGGRSKLLIYDDPHPTTNAGESDDEDDFRG